MNIDTGKPNIKALIEQLKLWGTQRLGTPDGKMADAAADALSCVKADRERLKPLVMEAADMYANALYGYDPNETKADEARAALAKLLEVEE